jgi:hypothetical protein
MTFIGRTIENKVEETGLILSNAYLLWLSNGQNKESNGSKRRNWVRLEKF